MCDPMEIERYNTYFNLILHDTILKYSRSTVPLVAAKNCDHPYQPLTTKVGGQTRPSWSHSVTPRWVWPDLTSTARGVPISNFFCPLHCTISGAPK